ncbi:SRPBCC domain-containing protein [Fulvivirgaceae bacterium BMA10]|uniref:SRPBCC domain-containing protein n=1 Tax=Splendidivirga corallicola TaxID=3051826 RepID=A0ABT8KJ57_9BACT|nr:SRPBCC domain-containing protein [Fulvivirgaceae bacterium BMA10]
MARSITKELIVHGNIHRVFKALITPSLITKWWFANTAIVLPEENGIYAVSWGVNEDDPDYVSVATIQEIDQPYRLTLVDFKYQSREGKLPFEADLPVEFTLEDLGNNTKLTLIQHGFPDDDVADEFYKGCVKGWNDTLVSFKNVVEQTE